MATQRNPLQVLKEAKQIARDHGCSVSERGGKYHVYRLVAGRPVWCGSRGSVTALRALVCSVTGFR